MRIGEASIVHLEEEGPFVHLLNESSSATIILYIANLAVLKDAREVLGQHECGVVAFAYMIKQKPEGSINP